MSNSNRQPAKNLFRLFISSSLLGLCLFDFSPWRHQLTAIANDNVPATENGDRQTNGQLTIYVNPNTGNDERGKGTLESPFKTITQALMLAKPATTIVLAQGVYSGDTGEDFPLMVKSNVTIQGDAKNIGKDIIIQGGGLYTSPTAASQNATIVASKNAGKIIGVTVINPNSRGHGLWIESASPEIKGNMFSGSGTSGVSVNGNSKPIITDNYFYQNRGNGLLVYGTSQVQVTNNIFDRTGFGISAVQNTLITALNNRFHGNRIGIILEGKAQAVLRHNSIENSTEDGIVTVAKSRLDLGTTQQPGKNTFKNNANSDIRNLTKTETITAYGNQLNDKNQGAVDLNANTSNVSLTASLPSNVSTDRSTPNILPPNEKTPTLKTPTTNSSNNNRNNTIDNDTVTGNTQTNNTESREIVFSAPTNTNTNTTPPETISNNTNSQSTTDKNPVGSLPPPPTTSTNNNLPTTTTTPTNTTTNSNNNSNSNGRNLSDAVDRLSGNKTSNNNNSVATNTGGGRGGYRVIVSTRDNSQKEEVKSLYPDAFATSYNGRSMLQVGVYNDRQNAEQILQFLKERGFNGVVLEN
jgi:parallel beta-helix repeat protein